MKLRFAAFALFALLVAPHSLFSQCSDAGVCSIGHRPSESPSHSISFAYTFGKSGTPDDLVFHNADLSAELGVTSDSRLSVSIPFSAQSGPLGSTSGAGDLIALWSQRLLSEVGFSLSLQGGVKLATGSVNEGGLPQAYQSGSGTTDLIIGINVQRDAWGFALGYQWAGGRSKNSPTRLKRGDDLLFRAGYTTRQAQTDLTFEALLIKRLQESSVITSAPGLPETFGNIPDSDQAQVNLVVRIAHPLSETLHFGGFAALPTLKRDVNVDGLKRALVLSAGLSVSL